MDNLEADLISAEGNITDLERGIEALPNNDQNANGCCYEAKRALELYKGLIVSVRTYVDNNNNNIFVNGNGAAAAAAGGKRKKSRKSRKSRK